MRSVAPQGALAVFPARQKTTRDAKAALGKRSELYRIFDYTKEYDPWVQCPAPGRSPSQRPILHPRSILDGSGA
eukprot:5272728-Pyramimonas_sp.AAC.1